MAELGLRGAHFKQIPGLVNAELVGDLLVLCNALAPPADLFSFLPRGHPQCALEQIVHRLTAQFGNLRFQEVTPQDGLGYRHNSGQDEAKNPYIIVRAYEGHYTYNHRPAVPRTPQLAQACLQGILDANYGQCISFVSSYKRCFRLEVPVWYDVDNECSPPDVSQSATEIATMAKPVSPVDEKAPEPDEDMHVGADDAPANENEEGGRRRN